MALDANRLLGLSDTQLLIELLKGQDHMADKLDQIAADEMTLVDTVVREEAAIKAIADIVTPLKAANDALAKTNADQAALIASLQAGEALTQQKIDALAANSAAVTASAVTAQSHLDALQAAVTPATVPPV